MYYPFLMLNRILQVEIIPRYGACYSRLNIKYIALRICRHLYLSNCGGVLMTCFQKKTTKNILHSYLAFYHVGFVESVKNAILVQILGVRGRSIH